MTMLRSLWMLRSLSAVAVVAMTSCGGGAAETPRARVEGLSAVEVAPATSATVTLTPNPLLVDADTTTGAGVDVGFGPTALGDFAARDVGIRFVDDPVPVNTIYVWLDRALPQDAAGALAGTVAVYRSDDNQRWVPVQIAAPPARPATEHRLEISIAEVHTRFLMAVLRPLPASMTLDATCRAVLVTELEVLLK